MHHSRDIPAYLPADKPHNAYNTYIYLSETYSRAPSFFNKITTVWAYLQGILRSHAASASAVNSYTLKGEKEWQRGRVSWESDEIARLFANPENLVIAKEKLYDYCLNKDHLSGGQTQLLLKNI